ncbi:hypothetical protein J699_01045 [Acinetobacter sp. 1000160]|nr:hypothetical protein J699_01045 [Acinetobacter sp. 1000160]
MLPLDLCRTDPLQLHAQSGHSYNVPDYIADQVNDHDLS